MALRCSIRLSFCGRRQVTPSLGPTARAGLKMMPRDSAAPHADTLSASARLRQPSHLTMLRRGSGARRRDGLCVLARTIQFSKNRPTVRPGRPGPSFACRLPAAVRLPHPRRRTEFRRTLRGYWNFTDPSSWKCRTDLADFAGLKRAAVSRTTRLPSSQPY